MISISSGSAIPVSSHTEQAAANAVSQALAHDPHTTRFKKLLIYRCTGLWESNSDRLEAVQFCDLLHTLRSIAPTWQELQSSLAEAANRLNKSTEYTLVAHALLGLLQPLYPDIGTAATVPQMYATIAHQLSCDPDLLRLKKLLILACTNQWKSDQEKLEQTPLLPLIERLHSLTLTEAGLCFLLESLVKTLSKSTEYRLLANRLIQALQPLYAAAPPEGAKPTALKDTPEPSCDDATADDAHSRSSTTTKFSTIAEATAALSALLHQQNKRSSSSLRVTAQMPASSSKALRPIDRFSLRQIVVQSSNPLRTKILLFSLLHEPFQLQHESMLKDHDLDDLLQMTLKTYPQVAHLETALYQVVKQLPCSQAYQQSVNAVLQAVQRSIAESSMLSHQAAIESVSYTAANQPTEVEATQFTEEFTEALTNDFEKKTALHRHRYATALTGSKAAPRNLPI